MVLFEGFKTKLNGQEKFLYGFLTYSPKHSFSSQMFTNQGVEFLFDIAQAQL